MAHLQRLVWRKLRPGPQRRLKLMALNALKARGPDVVRTVCVRRTRLFWWFGLETCHLHHRSPATQWKVLGVLSRKAQFLQRITCPFFRIFLKWFIYMKLICSNSCLPVKPWLVSELFQTFRTKSLHTHLEVSGVCWRRLSPFPLLKIQEDPWLVFCEENGSSKSVRRCCKCMVSVLCCAFSDLRVLNDIILVHIANIFAGMVFVHVRCMTGARLAPSSDDMFAARRAQTDLQFSLCVTSFDPCKIRRRVMGNCGSCSICSG